MLINKLAKRTGWKRRVQNMALLQEVVETSGDHDQL
jgi:hypothetical protein